MPLQRLVELHERIADRLEPEHHQRRAVRWLIDLDAEGRFLGFVETTGDDKKPQQFVVPYRRRMGTRPPPYLLADTPAYVLGLGLDKMDDPAAAPRHAEFVNLVEKCAHESGEPAVEAVWFFLMLGLEAARADAPTDLAAGDVLTFRVGEQIVTNLPSVRAFWQQYQAAGTADANALESECLLCGQHRPIASRHPVELHLGRDRVQIITANKSAFESFGLGASEIAPVCFPCALRYGQAANYLMTSSDHRYSAGGVHYLYWTRTGGGGGVFALLQNPQPEQVRKLLQSPFAPGLMPEVEEEAFYAFSATSNTGRLVVRDWIETTVGEVKRHLARYFALQELVGLNGEPFEPVGLYALAGSLVRQMDDLPPQVLPALLGCALHGRPLPVWLLHQAVRRAHADTDNRVTRPRAMLIKMVLQAQLELERRIGPVKEALDPQNHHPAYLCGRLLRLLEEAQEAAIPGIGATLVDRFFATASTAPAAVFGRLMRGSQNHLAKLRRDRPSAYHALQARIEEVVSGLTTFPAVLSLTEQGLFTLGYYHQRAADRAAAAQAAQARRGAQPSEPEGPLDPPDPGDENATTTTEKEV